MLILIHFLPLQNFTIKKNLVKLLQKISQNIFIQGSSNFLIMHKILCANVWNSQKGYRHHPSVTVPGKETICICGLGSSLCTLQDLRSAVGGLNPTTKTYICLTEEEVYRAAHPTQGPGDLHALGTRMLAHPVGGTRRAPGPRRNRPTCWGGAGRESRRFQSTSSGW